MIVMKFGGSSLASASSFSQVVSIVQSERSLNPVIVASAMGDTTDLLLQVVAEARWGHAFAALKLQDSIKNQHFAVCEALLHGRHLSSMEQYLQKTFRDLHVRMLEVCEGEQILTPESQDCIVSVGEQLSSRLLAEVLDEYCGPAIHLDARKLILTDSNFTDAEPRYWETYARIRWSVPIAAREKLVVAGGFIGSTEDGRTTTLGRGGSDLTASIIGAALNADEVQVWKDVDGMLTCDPRIFPAGRRVKRLSYQEATELAESGAAILHPKTMEPARRLGIPIVIRNTFRPENEGTRIEGTTGRAKNVVKSLAIKQGITLLEVRSTAPDGNCDALIAFCKRFSSAARVLFSGQGIVYVSLDEKAKLPEGALPTSACLQVRIMSRQAIITLVGESLERAAISRSVSTALQGASVFLIPGDQSTCSIRIAVPMQHLKHCAGLLHRAFFAHSNPEFFATASAGALTEITNLNVEAQGHIEKAGSFVPSFALVQSN